MASGSGLRRWARGLSEAASRERFGTEAACRAALLARRWREGLACPACGGRSFRQLRTRRLFQCNRCKRQVRLTAGTVFQDSKPPLVTWFAAIYHLTQSKGGISSVELGRRLGAKQGTAWLMGRKLMRAMASREATEPKLSGRIAIDRTYLGGERRGGERGRGAAEARPARRRSSPRSRPRPSASRGGSGSAWSGASASGRSRGWPSATSPPAAP
jgi:transposase-like protein